ncbi:cytochrome P450 81Q32-like [Dioscorea cayenensis subsp. rotundata]|uniref:Cytochrome P450 81Q32-like n=1 Tax=Dioscorea cayennensis subsp. rotundata TaxID=55577 RepID=A0AB40CHZ6_DIOCR|nr:cytochrome P450 81Q32-like [Dioscorea cayenensis subsp. rotundata]
MNTLVFYGATIALGIIIVWRLFHRVKKEEAHQRRQRAPPSIPWSLPILGHLHLMRHPVHQRLAGYASSYGPILSLRFGSRPTLIVSSAAIAEECLVAKDTAFANRPLLTASEVFGYDYTAVDSASYGPHWRSLRRIMAHEVLSQARVTSFAGVRGDGVKGFLGKLCRDSGRVTMRVYLSELTFSLMVRIVMGKRYVNGGGEEGREFRRIVEEVFLLSGKLCMDDFLPWWVAKLFGGGLKERIVKLGKEMDELLQNLVDERRRQRKEVEETAVIDVLLALQEKDPGFYSDVIIKGILLTLVSAGTDTVTGTLEWAMALLLNHPKVLNKARDEIAMQVGNERLLTDTDLPELSYLHNIIKETLRLFPAAPVLLPHESAEDCTISGFNVPSGTLLLVNAYAIHRDPELWKDPLKFDPERFDRKVGDQGKDFKYIPFGSGRRGCPGEGFSKRMMMLTLGSLIQCFEWERIGEDLVDLDEGEGLAMPKAIPLEAICKPWPHMLHLLSQP